jgi:TPR repeat protein
MLVGLVITGTAAGDPYDDARSAYDRGDYAAALAVWQPLADGGNARAQNSLGTLYRDGRGVAKDESVAVMWFRKAATQGYAAGQNNLGVMYRHGRGGLPQDLIEAAQWYRLAAEQGLALAQNNLGYMYESGQGVPKDEAEAVRWYRKAAEQGNASAQTNLGIMYRDGRGTASNPEEAVAWFTKAAALGDARARRMLDSNEKKSGDTPLATEPAIAGINRSATFDVGRVTLRMPDDKWESIGRSSHGIRYSGDRSGEVPLDRRHLLLRADGSGRFLAAMMVSTTRGVGGVQMGWTMTCQPGKNAHVVDYSRRHVSGSECLTVTGLVQTQRYLESVAPALLADLARRNVALPATAFAVIESAGLANGAYIQVLAVFASDFKLPMEGIAKGNLPDAIKPEVAAWGTRLADAVSESIHSLSGTLTVPAVTATTDSVIDRPLSGANR